MIFDDFSAKIRGIRNVILITTKIISLACTAFDIDCWYKFIHVHLL